MKFTLIAAFVLLALAQGSIAQDAGNLDLTQIFENLKMKMVEELSRNQDLTNQAQSFVEEKKTQLEPLAAQIQEQVRTAMVQLEEQMKPLAANAQAQFQPMVENLQKQMEELFQNLKEKVAPMAN